MLPAPVSIFSRRRSLRPAQRKRFDRLLAQARITNLGVLLLSSLFLISLLFNLHHYFSGSRTVFALPTGILSTLSRSPAFLHLSHLIVVTGHAIWNGTDAGRRGDEREWVLEPYQRGGGRVAAFYDHISHGVRLAMIDEHSLLVFSGGQTREKTATDSEGQSYLRLAIASGLIKQPPLRVTTEDHALDSFQNLLFSIARFKEYTGRYPTRITVIGYESKRSRFIELHCAAIRWPAYRFDYVGIDPYGSRGLEIHGGEVNNGYKPYQLDLYGCHDFLLSKRRQRNPFARFHSYYTSAPEIQGLLDWCPGVRDGGNNALYSGPLPWV